MTEFNIKHSFVSLKLDGSDASLVKPTDWNAALVGTTGAIGQHLVSNPTVTSGISWQDIGFSYLTDEAGNILTDEAGNALEGKDTVDVKPTFIQITFADSPYTVPSDAQVIEVTIDNADIDINLAALASATFELLIVRNDTGPGTAILDVIPDGSEKIKEPGTGILLDNKAIAGDGSSLTILPINTTHWYIT